MDSSIRTSHPWNRTEQETVLWEDSDRIQVSKAWKHSLRLLPSVSTRMKQIVKSCVRFSACHSTIIASKLAGFNEDDISRVSTAPIHGEKFKNPVEDIGKPFKIINAWHTLRSHETFLPGGVNSCSIPDAHRSQRQIPEIALFGLPRAALPLDRKGEQGAVRSEIRDTACRTAVACSHNSRLGFRLQKAQWRKKGNSFKVRVANNS